MLKSMKEYCIIEIKEMKEREKERENSIIQKFVKET